MKKIKKINPSYIVELDDIESLNDIDAAFALAKQNAGLALTDDELFDIIEWVADTVRPNIHVHIMECPCNCCVKKKLPWYKRFWNWMTRKNK